jgi:extradiol dioxygenase family protein
LKETEFTSLANRLENEQIKFIISPHRRFVGQPGEQLIMFIKDPSGNNLEFKSMKNPDYLFAKYNVVETKI